jgi:pimeloyl-ACP methyl ester carboxylesterase
MLTFYSKKRKILGEDEFEIPRGRVYEQYKDKIIAWSKHARKSCSEELSIKSHDGLILRAKYYEYKKGAITELLFNGYRGSAERDLSAAIERCFALGHNALLIDQRSSGRSDGHIITFGIRESQDCLAWVDFAIKKFGEDCRLMISGVSMGASTVLLAAGKKLPKNVLCALGDCPYSSARGIIKTVLRALKLPAFLYFFIRMGALIYGGFDINTADAKKSLERACVPVILLHGDGDRFVPCEMSKINYDACASIKQLVIIKGAGHGLCYLKEPETYLKALDDFYNKINK